MIYLNNTAEAQVMTIPKVGRDANGDLLFKIKSMVDLSEVVKNVIDLNTSELYYMLSVILENVSCGEYEYTLLDNDGVLSSGILMITEESTAIAYNNTIEYEQYN